MSQKRIALITGATSGIGEATARLLAINNFKLILCGRRMDRLTKIADELKPHTEITTLSFEVRNQQEVATAIASLPVEWKEIDVLVNNAGNAHGMDPIQTGSLNDWDAMIDINVKGLLYVTREVLPVMVKRNAGHIINIGSIAGRQVYPKGAVYCASKFAVHALTQGMLMDLVDTPIRVSTVDPGLTKTEFTQVRFRGDDDKAKPVYQGMTPLRAEDIADAVLFCATRPAHVNIAEMLVLPTDQTSVLHVHREG